MKMVSIPSDIENFLRACGGAETSRLAGAVQRKRAWRKNLGAAILRRRVSLGWTHGQLAARMGQRRATAFLSRLEQGLPAWPKSWDRFLTKLAAALGTTREQLEQEASA